MSNNPIKPVAVWLVLLAAAGCFALTMGTRQTMGLFLSSLNASTGLGLGSISLAFAFGQLWWGLTQPICRGFCRQGGRRACPVPGRESGGAGHVHHAIHDHNGGFDFCHRRAGRGWCGYGRACGIDGRHGPVDSGQQAWYGHGHRECGWFVRAVPDGPHCRGFDDWRGLGQCHAGAGSHRVAGVACCVFAQGKRSAWRNA